MATEITEEKRQENRKALNLYFGAVTGVFGAYLLGYAGSLMESLALPFLESCGEVFSRLGQMQFGFHINFSALMGAAAGVGLGAAVYFLESVNQERMSAYDPKKVAGSARFLSKKELAEYEKAYIQPDPEDLSKPFPNMIMSNRFRRPINSRLLIGNNNVLVVGGAGTGKSRFIVKPNILQMNASYVITDPSGEIIYSLGNVLKDFGYKIKILNISDMAHSNCYNPLHYIRDEAGVSMLIDCLIKNTTQDGSKGDEFFTNAERLLYSACIFYLTEFCMDESRRNFSSIVNMINASAVDELNPNAKSPLDCLFEALPKDSLAWKFYSSFKQATGKTLKSIIISCITRLQPFMTPQVSNLTRTDNMELEKIGEEKTALFIITPQADRTYSFLASMLYSQLFETLYYIGEQQKAAGGSKQLKIPVRCVMDEFANIGEVPQFPSKLSTMRKYNISATVILQDISQIESMYKDEWKTIVGNCSSIVFLGTQEPNTLKYFSEMLGKGTVKNKSRGISKGKSNGSNQSFQNTGRELMFPDELARMPSSQCIVFTQNMAPVRDDKYKYERHPRYHLTADADNSLGFQYNRMPAYNNNHLCNISSLLKAKAEAARAREEQMVTDGRTLDKKARMPLATEEALDRMEFPSETSSYLAYTEDLQRQWMEDKRDLAQARAEHLPVNRMLRILKQSIPVIPEKTLLGITDLHLPDRQVAVAVSNPDLRDFLHTGKEKALEEQDGFVLAWVSQDLLEDYLKEVEQAFEAGKADRR